MRPSALVLVSSIPAILLAGGACGSGSSTDSTTSDAGVAADGASGSTGDGGTAAGPKRIFVTAAGYTGDLKTQGGGASGLEGADALCANAGEAALLGRNFKAWLSDDTANAIDRIEDVGPWYFPAPDGGVGARVFNNKAQLKTLPLVAIRVTEQGGELSGTAYAWSGTMVGGSLATNAGARTCAGWTSGSNGEFGVAGDVQDASNWTQLTARACATTAHLYCIGQ